MEALNNTRTDRRGLIITLLAHDMKCLITHVTQDNRKVGSYSTVHVSKRGRCNNSTAYGSTVQHIIPRGRDYCCLNRLAAATSVNQLLFALGNTMFSLQEGDDTDERNRVKV